MYRQHYAAVLAYCARRLPPDSARDAAAGVFLVAWRRFDEMPTHELPWLLRTASFTVKDIARTSARQTRVAGRVAAVDPPSPAPDPADAYGARDDVRAALLALSDRDRELLLLTAWDGLDVAAAARVVGATTPTVRVRLHRARRRFAARLAAATDDPSPERALDARPKPPPIEEPA